MVTTLQTAGRTNAPPARILIVDDNEPDVVLLERMLHKQFGAQTQVRATESGAEALALVEREAFDAILLDYRLADMDGLELLSALQAAGNPSAKIVLTGQGNESIAVEAMRRGAHDYLVKRQMQPELVERSVRQAILAAGKTVLRPAATYRAEPAHAEIDHFMRSLSHDMSANFMLLEHSFNRLKRSCADSPLPAMADGVTHVEACLQQSKRFLDDLVLLARSGSVGMEAARVDLSRAVAETLYELADPIAERGVQVSVARNLPAVWCNPTRLKQVLGNLLHNALKHGGDRLAPRIEITRLATEDPAWVWLQIFDNGPGIAANYQQEVFRPGWRPPGTIAPGTGMGLAIVKKIVEHYGGQISLEAGATAGTAFRLSLPAAGDR